MLRSLSVLTVSVLFLSLCAGSAAADTPWPSNSTGTNIGSGLVPAAGEPSFEPSGIVWDNVTSALWLVGDESQLARMQPDGSNPTVWTLAGGYDLESVAVTGTTNKLYLGQEYDSTSKEPVIREYTSSSTAAPTATGKTWVLDMPNVTSSDGMEGLTWVPNGYHPYAASASGGVFFASSQADGRIYVYDVNLSQSGTLTRLGWFTPDSSHDISDLYFSTATRTLFVLYDTANKLLEIDTSTEQYPIMSTYTLPTSTDGQEGVTLKASCPGASTNIFIADDNGSTAHNVFSFNNFPQLCAQVLGPSANATTNQSSPTKNYGDGTFLDADSASGADKDFLIQFSLSGVTTSQISRAQLVFYVTDGTDMSPQYCATSTNWSETGVTWSNQPACSGSNQSGGASVSSNIWFAYDMKNALQGGSTSFRFSPRSTNDFVANSRHATSNHPQLILWLTGQ